MDSNIRSPPQHGNHVPANAFPEVGVPQRANVLRLPVLQRTRSPPSPHQRPALAQPHGYAGALQGVVVSVYHCDLSRSLTLILYIIILSHSQ